MSRNRAALLVLLAVLIVPALLPAAPGDPVGPKERCPVCGMFVARYPNWVSQIRLADGKLLSFDGMKDLMAYYFHPQEYGGAAAADIREIRVRDYYTLAWLDAKRAYFVTGSDVHGPMGHEFIPFASEKAARAFLKDHQGKQVLPFAAITDELVQSLRAGQKMRR